MRNTTYRIEVLIMPDRSDSIAGFLDMLRYDGSTVESWNQDNTDRKGLIGVVLNRKNLPHTIDRWHSFGINVAELPDRSY